MRYFLTFVVVVSVCGCGQSTNWPSNIIIEDGFSEYEHSRVVKAITEFNRHVGSDALQINNPSLSFVTRIRAVSHIPEQERSIHSSACRRLYRGAIAGQATTWKNRCNIEMIQTLLYSKDSLYPLLWHELGHCFGLDHVLEEREIMYYSLTPLDFLSSGALGRFFQSVKTAVHNTN